MLQDWHEARVIGLQLTVPKQHRARLLFQHGVGLARVVSFVPTNYEQYLRLSE